MFAPSRTIHPSQLTAATDAAPGEDTTHGAGAVPPVDADAPADTAPRHLAAVHESEDGSLVTEYGLLAVVAATVAGVVIAWAGDGALVTLFNALLRQARALVGA